MQLTEVTFEDAVPVDGYGPGFFRVGGQVLHGAVIVTAEKARVWGGPEDGAALLALAGDVDVIFVGMGAEIAFLPGDLRQSLEAAGIGVEVMNSPSACRTYNVLVSEGRRVALAVLPV
ncbi:MAG: Mth938-like domain-containing protein [Thalassovita sp.]|nr:Mth938-like domain-containing protein [Thalassovita sp.]